MKRNLGWIFSFLVTCAVIGTALPTAYAATLLKLNLSTEFGANFGFDNGMLSALDDGVSSTLGSRNVAIEFGSLGGPASLSFAPPADSSFTLTGLMAAVPATTFNGSLVVQDFELGNLIIYGPDDSPLLTADLSMSAITGPVGPPNTQGLFLAIGKITGGSILQDLRLDRESLRVKMKLPTVTNGFSVSPPPGAVPPPTHLAMLDPFTATTLSIEVLATVVPEPVGATLWGIGGAMLVMARCKKRA
jgi:hypothetical protein